MSEEIPEPPLDNPNIEKNKKDFESFLELLRNNREAGALRYDYFVQYTTLADESMKEIYGILHELLMAKQFTAEFKVGDICLVVNGPNSDSKNLALIAQETFKSLLKDISKVLKKEELLKKEEKQHDRDKRLPQYA